MAGTSCDFTDAVRHHAPRLLRREAATIRERVVARLVTLLRLSRPQASQLRDLLFNRHPPEQVAHARLHGQSRIAVRGARTLRTRAREQNRREA
jgi:hypothetical protein